MPYGEDAVRKNEDNKLKFSTRLKTIGWIVLGAVVFGTAMYYTS